MATDRKITELPVSGSVTLSDVSVLVRNGADYQFAFSSLLEFVQTNVSSGAAFSFGNTLPQNNTGKNGDIFVNAATNAIAQKVSGIWVVKYNFPSVEELKDGTVLYGSGTPGTTIGKDNDTYIDTTTGVFYTRVTDLWEPVFSMQTGPAGAKGDKGDTGAPGTAGKTVLNGLTDPSNLNTGTDGDFYINTSTLKLFGPKTDGDWGNGVDIIQRVSDERYFTYTATPALVNWQGSNADTHGNFPRVTLLIEDEEGNEIVAPGAVPKYVIDRSNPNLPLVTTIYWELPEPVNCRILIN